VYNYAYAYNKTSYFGIYLEITVFGSTICICQHNEKLKGKKVTVF
jgi:hypothetical protein